MDPITQGALGAIASQSLSKKSEFRWACIIGILAGMAPDLDIFIRSSSDPMVYYLYHRNFSHSLIFIPFGALIVSLFLHIFLKQKIKFKRNYLYSVLGFGTHGLLDACTSYGTLILWPFSDFRFAWNNVSIVDPLFTLPLILLVFLSTKKQSKNIARLGLSYAVLYLAFGVIQNKRAEKIGYEIALERGHLPTRLTAKPSIGNLYIWRILYEYDDYFYADAVKVGWDHKVYSGEKIKKLQLKSDFPWVREGSQHHIDIEKFRWFSNDFLGIHPDDPLAIGDIRYALSPGSIYPLWGIELIPNKDNQHVKSVNFRRKSLKDSDRLLDIILD